MRFPAPVTETTSLVRPWQSSRICCGPSTRSVLVLVEHAPADLSPVSTFCAITTSLRDLEGPVLETLDLQGLLIGCGMMATVVPWREAMQRALYGPGGFFVAGDGPAGHFRTSAVASGWFAGAVARLAERVDAALDRPARLDLVDIGAGRGELLLGLAAELTEPVRSRARFVAVEHAPRPTGLPEWIEWRHQPPEDLVGLVFATEWLDNVPLDVVEVDEAGEPRLVLVDQRTGAERLDGAPAPADQAWLARWWPVDRPGARAEIGHTRDAAWASAVAALRRGLALAVDYGHLAAHRPAAGTVTGFREGRQVTPVPDGSCDVTAHVAMDSVAAAAEATAGVRPVLCGQREALRALGVTGRRPPLSLATTDPAEYVRRLASATRAAELTDPAGLGGHYWLLQPVALPGQLLPGVQPDDTAAPRHGTGGQQPVEGTAEPGEPRGGTREPP